MRAAVLIFLLPMLASAKPNLIFLLSDDLAQGDIGAYGQKLIQTRMALT